MAILDTETAIPIHGTTRALDLAVRHHLAGLTFFATAEAGNERINAAIQWQWAGDGGRHQMLADDEDGRWWGELSIVPDAEGEGAELRIALRFKPGDEILLESPDTRLAQHLLLEHMAEATLVDAAAWVEEILDAGVISSDASAATASVRIAAAPDDVERALREMVVIGDGDGLVNQTRVAEGWLVHEFAIGPAGAGKSTLSVTSRIDVPLDNPAADRVEAIQAELATSAASNLATLAALIRRAIVASGPGL